MVISVERMDEDIKVGQGTAYHKDVGVLLVGKTKKYLEFALQTTIIPLVYVTSVHDLYIKVLLLVHEMNRTSHFVKPCGFLSLLVQ